MQTLETLRRAIGSTETLHTVVHTMKVLSMTSIRQCEEAVAALSDYNRSVRLGLQAALRHRPRDIHYGPAASSRNRVGAIVFGSAWGMCGRFNEQLASFAARELEAMAPEQLTLLALGEYVGGRLGDAGRPPDERHPVPDAVDGITARVQELLVAVEAWQSEQHIGRVVLFYHESTSGTGYAPRAVPLLPVDTAWLEELEAEPWPTRMLPDFRMAWEPLFAALFRQYLFVTLYRAFAESLASEHSSRLAAMQAAQDNVEERLDELHARFHRQRQNAITEELLDITSGFEALRTGEGSEEDEEDGAAPSYGM